MLVLKHRDEDPGLSVRGVAGGGGGGKAVTRFVSVEEGQAGSEGRDVRDPAQGCCLCRWWMGREPRSVGSASQT